MTFVNISRLREIAELEYGSEERVQGSAISEVPEEGLREFLTFVRDRLNRRT